jgi:hypothetical protein
MTRRSCRILAAAVLCVAIARPAVAERPLEDVIACDRAAAQAEREWHLPDGLLGAIGAVESFRSAAPDRPATVWPWTINSDGQSFYLASKQAAVNIARLLLDHGARYVDVGCFQVDLWYHPGVFSSLEEAFDPDANARAAADILRLARFSATGWTDTVARYHSATPSLGEPYAARVLAAWSYARRREVWADWAARLGPPPANAVLLSPQALLVRVVTPSGALGGEQAGQGRDLPRVVNPGDPGAPSPRLFAARRAGK